MKKTKKNVLVIDDDADLCDLMTIILSKQGYDVKAMKHFDSLDGSPLPDIIVLDILLLNGDGRKICRQIKNGADTRHIPVLMYSAGTNLEKYALEAGADDFIAKPFEIKKLVEKIKSLTLSS